jgi:CheY-like chemotaxis protein
MTKKSKILIVDDHPAIRSTMVDVLNEEGFVTDIAENGKIALEKCISEKFDFVLMDVQMPELNGVEVFREIKNRNITSPKFIFFSAYSLPELRKEAENLGCLAFLEKPIEIKKIIYLLKENKSIPILVYLNDSIQGEELCNALKNENYYTILATNIDQVLIQLRQINFKILVFDSDLSQTEHDAIKATIKTHKANTICIETNEDENIKLVLDKVSKQIQKDEFVDTFSI